MPHIYRIALALCIAGMSAGEAVAQEAPKPAPGAGNVVLDLDKEMPLSNFLDHMSKLTGRPVLYDPNDQRIRGQKLGAQIEVEVPSSRLFDTFRALCTAFELTLVPIGPTGYEVYLVVSARSTNNLIKNKALFIAPEDVPAYRDRDGLFVATLFPITHIKNLTYVRTALSTMVSPAGIGRVMEIPEVGIIVMDFAPVVGTVQELIKRMDVPSSSGQVLEMIELKSASAAEVAEAVQELYMDAATPASASRPRRAVRLPTPPPRIVPYPTRNAVVVRGTRLQFEAIKKLVATLDKPRPAVQILVLRLEHARAEDLAAMLNPALSVRDKSVRIIADGHTNSLIIAGKRSTIEDARQLVGQLDVASPKPESAK